MAFDAIIERYPQNDVSVVMYHLHIPYPDPMTNPSTLVRAKSCDVQGTPSYTVDGKMASGGGGREKANSNFARLNSQIEERLSEPAEARIILDAFYKDGTINTRVTVDEITADSSELRLQIALVEEELSYSGQNNLRFHPMVVRSLGGEGHMGFVLDPSKESTIECSFNLKEITKELKTHLDEIENERKMTFSQKKYEINKDKLFIASFVQETESRHVLQSAYLKVKPASDLD